MESPDGVTSRLLTAEEVARILGLSEGTLKCWRVRRRRDGPPFVKLGSRPRGRVRYRLEDIMAYIEQGRRDVARLED